MDPEDERRAKILVYDGDCRFCVRAVRTFVRPCLTGSTRARPFEAFEGNTAGRLRAAGIHNEMAVLDPETDEIRSGFDGALWVLRDGRLPWLAGVLGFGPVGWLLRHDYKLFAYNRRIFRPPARDAACACDPDLHRGYRWAFLATTWLWAALLGAAAAVFLLPDSPVQASARAWIGAACAPIGWLLLAPFAWRLPSPHDLDFLGHLGWTLAAIFVPPLCSVTLALVFALLGWRHDTFRVLTASEPAEVLFVAGIGAGLLVGLVSCMRRLPRVGLSLPTALGAGLVLGGTPAATLAWLAWA